MISWFGGIAVNGLSVMGPQPEGESTGVSSASNRKLLVKDDNYWLFTGFTGSHGGKETEKQSHVFKFTLD